MVVAVSEPHPIVAAQAVQQDHDLAVDVGDGGAQGFRVEIQRPTFSAEPHRDGEWVGGFGQVVADDAVEGCDQRGFFDARGGLGDAGLQWCQRPVDTHSGDPGDLPDGAVDHAADRPPAARLAAGDRGVHLLDHLRHGGGPDHREAGSTAEVLDRIARTSAHDDSRLVGFANRPLRCGSETLDRSVA